MTRPGSPHSQDPGAARPSTPPPLVCTLLPTFNERQNIEPLIRGLLAGGIPYHMILVVDDDSPDGTWQIVQALAAELNPPPPARPVVALFRRLEEKGLTSAIQGGIDRAIQVYGAQIVTWMDCDLSMPPEDVPRLVQAIREQGADVAIGSRWIPGGSDIAHGFMARTLSWVINHFAMLLLGSHVSDYTSGFIAAKATVLSRIPLHGDYGEYCIDLLCRAHRLGYRLQEVPYACVPRTAGASKTGANLWDYLGKGRKYVGTVVRLWMQG